VRREFVHTTYLRHSVQPEQSLTERVTFPSLSVGGTFLIFRNFQWRIHLLVKTAGSKQILAEMNVKELSNGRKK
jgi:hypothetical protein